MDGHRLHVFVPHPSRCQAMVSSVSSQGQKSARLGQDLDDGASATILGRREAMAQFFELGDPEAASALRSLNGAPQEALAPWETTSAMACLTQDQINQSGLSRDALLYVSAYTQDRDAVRHYLGMGADPLQATYDGDCAARMGVSLGMPEFMTRAWINAKDQNTGETGLHQLASKDMLPELRAAIAVGGRMEEQDIEGRSVWQHFRASSQERMVRELMPLAMSAHAQASQEGISQALSPPVEQQRESVRARRRM
jgi:hypothetical protein